MEATQDMTKGKNRKTIDDDDESIYEIEKKTEEAYRREDLSRQHFEFTCKR